MNDSAVKIARFFGKLLGKKNATSIITFLHKAADAPIMYIALNHYGILKGTDMKNSGEEFAIASLFKKFIDPDDIVIDIGANTGEYSLTLRKHLPLHRIWSIEPNTDTFNKLVKNVDTECFNFAISTIEGKQSFFVSNENPISTLGSLSKNSIPTNETLKEISVNCITLERLIKNENIKSIGVLKVDTEGYDFNVLKSGEAYLKDIKFIQFEFNEFHVYTRSFIKDFHDLLSSTHALFRLDTNFLHDLRVYDPKMEIFRFQNILAVRNDLVYEISKYIKR
ncbi:FkbM family methyltransferase [Cryomorpha ignava]|uniref:FkbM family methyltransferase n=1 Tax=Cryomorpha ignava TaxID=101383 RepID=A0A7K3WRG0_9FLAO|nr:FkbM family methyltransferase [Cryomorpha ignava]NEN23422.1 FkbM family methyltransferase [Cryomorpha ignava]